MEEEVCITRAPAAEISLLYTLEGHGNRLGGLAVCGDGVTLLSATGEDRREANSIIIAWDVAGLLAGKLHSFRVFEEGEGGGNSGTS